MAFDVVDGFAGAEAFFCVACADVEDFVVAGFKVDGAGGAGEVEAADLEAVDFWEADGEGGRAVFADVVEQALDEPVLVGVGVLALRERLQVLGQAADAAVVVHADEDGPAVGVVERGRFLDDDAFEVAVLLRELRVPAGGGFEFDCGVVVSGAANCYAPILRRQNHRFDASTRRHVGGVDIVGKGGDERVALAGERGGLAPCRGWEGGKQKDAALGDAIAPGGWDSHAFE